MTNAMKEYSDARAEWRSALREENEVKIRVQHARHRFLRAKEELRAEEQELIELSPGL